MLKLIDGITTLANNNVVVMDKLREEYPDKFNETGSMNREWFEKEIRNKYHIYLRKDVNSVAFKLKDDDKCAVGCNLSPMISFLIETVHGSSIKHDKKEKDYKYTAIRDKYNTLLDNLLFAFKHLNELREMEGSECEI